MEQEGSGSKIGYCSLGKIPGKDMCDMSQPSFEIAKPGAYCSEANKCIADCGGTWCLHDNADGYCSLGDVPGVQDKCDRDVQSFSSAKSGSWCSRRDHCTADCGGTWCPYVKGALLEADWPWSWSRSSLTAPVVEDEPMPASDSKPADHEGEVAPPPASDSKPADQDGEVAPPPASDSKPADQDGEVAPPPASDSKPADQDGEVAPPPASDSKPADNDDEVAPLNMYMLIIMMITRNTKHMVTCKLNTYYSF